MERAGNVKEAIEGMIDEGEKPCALKIAEKLDYTVDDVHRCLNYLERENDIESYTRSLGERNYRFVSLFRE